jgi:hypothetical protein
MRGDTLKARMTEVEVRLRHDLPEPFHFYRGMRGSDTRDPGIEIFIRRFISMRDSAWC